MVNMNILGIMAIIVLLSKILIVFLLLILIIVVVVYSVKNELNQDCNKGFSYFFIFFLIFMMFYNALHILIGVLSSPNEYIALIILIISMEIYLFHKKSKWKFGILTSVLLIFSFILRIVEIIMLYLSYYGVMTYFIISLIANVLINLNFMIIAIIILVLLKKTADENATLKKYTGFLSAGVVLLFIIYPIFTLIINNLMFLLYLLNYSYEFYLMLSQGANLVRDFIFIIGIIFLTVGAIKTMTVPLTFSKEKRIKGIPRKIGNRCPKCDVLIPDGMQFCTNCGYNLF